MSRTRSGARVCCLAGAVAVILVLTGPANAVYYAVTDLGSLDPDPNYSAVPFAVSSSGQVVGAASIYVYYHLPRAFLWEGGTLSDLGTLPGSGLLALSAARGINDAGYVVGINMSLTDATHNHAFLWPGSGTMTDLGSMTADANDLSGAYAINNGGHIVGSWNLKTDPNTPHAFLRWSSGTVTQLGSLGGNSSFAWDINDSNHVVGKAKTVGGQEHAFFWENGVMTDLGVLPGYTAGSQAIAINASGQIVGTSSDPNGVVRSFLYANGTMTDLGTLPGGTSAIVGDINNRGLIVGTASDPNGQNRAVLWKNGTIYDLNSLINPASGWVLQSAQSINENGQIVGTGTLNGLPRGFLVRVYTIVMTIVGADKGYVECDPNAVFLEPNVVVTLTAVPNENKHFEEWSGDVPAGHETDNPLSITMDTCKSITATFKCGTGLGPFLPAAGLALLALVCVRRWA